MENCTFLLSYSSFIANHGNLVRHCYPLESLTDVPCNPVYIVTNKLKRFFSNIKAGDRALVFSQLEDIDNVNQQVEELPVNVENSVIGDNLTKAIQGTNESLSGRVLQNRKENGDCFFVIGTEIDFFLPPSSESHPISHKMVAVHNFMEEATVSEVKSEVDNLLEVFIKEICSNLDGLRSESRCKSESQANSPTSETIQLTCRRQTKVNNLSNAASADIGCECESQTTQGKCIFCRLERQYLGCDNSSHGCTKNLFQPSTQMKLYHKEKLILSCSVLDANVASAKTYPDDCFSWLMEVNLDNLAMALCGIHDIRLLWSQDKRFKEQFSDQKVGCFYELCNWCWYIYIYIGAV